MRSTTQRIVPCLIASALVFAACGSDDAADVAGDAADTAEDAAGDAADAGEEAMEEGEEAAGDAMAEGEEAMEEGEDAMEEGEDAMEEGTEEAMEEGEDAMEEGEDAMEEGEEAMEEGEDAMAADGEPLKVGVKFDQPLFGVNTPDGVVGFDAEIANLIGEKLGRPVEFQEAVSANRESFLENGTVDMVVATYTINDERDEVVDFAGPYYVAGQDILVLADNPEGIEGIDSLNSGDINTCTVEGSTSLDNLNEMAPDASVSTFDTYSKCTDAMDQGSCRRGDDRQRHPARPRR